jgi:hypothetical protein
MGDANLDLDTLIEGAWRRFRAALAEALDRLDERGTLQVTLDSGDQLDVASPYIQALRVGDSVVLEVASNRFLAGNLRLSKSCRRRLRGLGLAKPTVAAPNYWASFPVTHVDQVASVVVAAFRDAYGVVHPAFLISDDVEWGSDKCLPAAYSMGDARAATYPVDRDHLDQLIDQALTPMLGHTPERDSDGDVPLRAGSAVVFVRSHGRTPLIRLFAEMVVEIADTDAAVHEVDALNREIEGVKFSLHGDKVLASADLLALPFAAEHLQCLLAHVCDVVSSHDAALARRTGGRVFLDLGDSDVDAESDARDDDEDIHPVMLCLLQLEAESPGSLRPKEAAKLCGYDADLLLELIRWNEEQEIAWREARDEAYATDGHDEAVVCEIERAHARRTVKLLRKALRQVLLR